MLKEYFKYKVEGDEVEPYGLQNIELTTFGMTWTRLMNEIETKLGILKSTVFFS